MGKSFIDAADVYCFGTGLPISRSIKDVFQYRHFKETWKLILHIVEIKPKPEEIIHFYLAFL